MPAKRANGHGSKTYILELKNGNTRKITVPSTWKMTYGSVVPYTAKAAASQQGARADYALRLYEGNKDNLRAVYTDVVAIRDASIQTVERRTSVQRKKVQKMTDQGLKDFHVEARMTEWVDPDNEDDSRPVPEEFLRLPAESE